MRIGLDIDKVITNFDKKILKEFYIEDKNKITKINRISDSLFLHYTEESNVESIFKNGLVPAIGPNSLVIEKSKKVFFSIGIYGALDIMDRWFRWLNMRPKSNIVYKIGAVLMPKKWFPKFVYELFFKVYRNNPRKSINNYIDFNKKLQNCVWLVLDLEECIDFSYSDLDEVKMQNFPKKYLKNIYNDVDDNKMEYWNMHTYTDKIIEPEKVSILIYNGEYKVDKILKMLIEENIDYVKSNCEQLYNYYVCIYMNN